MTSYFIKRKRIHNVKIPIEFDLTQIQIGIPANKEEAKKVNLFQVGDIVLPDAIFGSQSKKNAYGYSYADKTKPKKRRYVSTNWLYPFGNTKASKIAVDIYKPCYPKKIVQPFGIELQLFEDENGQLFVLANMTQEIREKYLKETINLILEIFGICYVFNGSLKLDYTKRRQRCNWEILPPGEKPSNHIKKQLMKKAEKANTYSIYRLEFIEKYKSQIEVEGINGFYGYFAYVFDNYCVLESAVYGNATYIIPQENWKLLMLLIP